MNEMQLDVPAWPQIELGGLKWTESKSRASYWRDFTGVGRAVITRVRDGSWGFCVRGQETDGNPVDHRFPTSWECAAGCRDEVSELRRPDRECAILRLDGSTECRNLEHHRELQAPPELRPAEDRS